MKLENNGKENIDIIDGILDEQAAKFPSGAKIAKAKRGVPIKMLNTDIEFLFDQAGANTGVLVCGIATVDGIYYGALCDARQFPPQGYVEELHMSPGNNSIHGVHLIRNSEEWSVLTDFFQRHQVWESKRIFNWIWAVKNGQINPSSEWMKRLNTDMKKGQVTKDDLRKNSNRILDSEIKKS